MKSYKGEYNASYERVVTKTEAKTKIMCVLSVVLTLSAVKTQVNIMDSYPRSEKRPNL